MRLLSLICVGVKLQLKIACKGEPETVQGQIGHWDEIMTIYLWAPSWFSAKDINNKVWTFL